MEKENKYKVLIDEFNRSSSINQSLDNSVSHIIQVISILVVLFSGFAAFFMRQLKDVIPISVLSLLALTLGTSVGCYFWSLKICVDIVTRQSGVKKKGGKFLPTNKIPLGKRPWNWDSLITGLRLRLLRRNKAINLKYARFKKSRLFLYVGLGLSATNVFLYLLISCLVRK